MSLLKITEFQKVYPKLWVVINEARIETGSRPLENDYEPNYSIPIRSFDASLAESFLERKEKVDYLDPKVVLGYSQLQKIISAVKTEPNMLGWLDILYYPKPKGNLLNRYKKELKIKQTKKEPKMAKVTKSRNKVDGEIIATVTAVTNGDENSFTALGNDGVDYTAEINQKKLKYAFENKGVVRGRKNDSGTLVWRVVKEKYVATPASDAEPTVAPTA